MKHNEEKGKVKVKQRKAEGRDESLRIRNTKKSGTGVKYTIFFFKSSRWDWSSVEKKTLNSV